MPIFNENYIADINVTKEVQNYYAAGKFAELNDCLAADASTPDQRYSIINVGATIEAIGRKLKNYQETAPADIGEFLEGTVTEIAEFKKDPEGGREKNFAWIAKTSSEDGFYQRFSSSGATS